MGVLLENKKAYFNYEILEKYEAGLELLGLEVKSLKQKHGNIAGARAIIRSGEAYLVGMDIPPYQPNNTPKDYERERTRKLLLHKDEISRLAGRAEERGLTVIATKVYTLGGRIKVEIAVVRGKKKFEKRDKIKKRDIEREIGKTLKRG
ncbi:SsrA-binding protein SmpB [Candidatus Giovannonibacteria bacterium]|nr:SsrA-binding protein SmpB [Candidatus Giovannonibacteria bacterium]